MMANKMDKKYLMVIAAMCGLATSAAGILVNTGGVFYTPIAEELGVGRGDVAMMMTVLSICLSFSGLLVPRMIRKIAMRPMVLVSAAVMVGATFLMAFCRELWQLYAVCAVRGFAGGLIGFVMISIVLNNWFIENLGLVTSIALCFSGVAGAFLSPLISSVIETRGWQNGFLVMGGMMLVTVLPAVIFPIDFTPEACGMKQYGYKESDAPAAVKEGTRKKVNLASFGPKVLLVCLSFSIMGNIASSFVPHLPSFANTIGLSASIGALMLSAGMMANIFGKIFIGALSDRIGTGKTLLIALAGLLGSIFLLNVVRSSVLLMIASFLCGLSYAISAVGRVVITKDMYGRENYGEIYPVLNFIASMIFAVCGSVHGFLYDTTGSYSACFYLLFAVTVGMIIAIYVGYFTGKKEK